MSWFKMKLFVSTTCVACMTKTVSCNYGDDKFNDGGGVKSKTGDDRLLVLKQVQVYFRHGARTPLQLIPGVEQVSYPLDFILRHCAHTEFSYEVCYNDNQPAEPSPFEKKYSKVKLKGGGHAGVLTSYGKDQMYMLGKRLRSKYIDPGLLDSNFSPQDVLVRSTNWNRTIESAVCVLAGVYGAQHLNQHGPVKIFTSPLSEEVLIPNCFNCSVIQKLNKFLYNFDSVPKLKEDRIKLENILGFDAEKIGKKLDIVLVRDDIVARKSHGLPLPEKLLPFMDMIEEDSTKILYFTFCGKNEEERKLVMPLCAGPAITLAVNNMQQAVTQSSYKKLCLYSTHDSMIICLLEAFGLYDETWPPFSADITVELYEDSHRQHWVRVLYLGQERVIRGCSRSLCSYEEFLSAVKPFITEPKQYQKMCNSNIPSTG